MTIITSNYLSIVVRVLVRSFKSVVFRHSTLMMSTMMYTHKRRFCLAPFFFFFFFAEHNWAIHEWAFTYHNSRPTMTSSWPYANEPTETSFSLFSGHDFTFSVKTKCIKKRNRSNLSFLLSAFFCLFVWFRRIEHNFVCQSMAWSASLDPNTHLVVCHDNGKSTWLHFPFLFLSYYHCSCFILPSFFYLNLPDQSFIICYSN